MIISDEYVIKAFTGFTGIILFILFIICLLLVLCWAPMDTKSKPISAEERKVYKKKINVIALVHLLVFIIMMLTKWNTIMYVIAFSYVTQVVMLFLEKIVKK
jgi:accessory gene regulator protein AgrB